MLSYKEKETTWFSPEHPLTPTSLSHLEKLKVCQLFSRLAAIYEAERSIALFKTERPPPQIQLPNLILCALTHFTFWEFTLILSSRLGFCLPNDVVHSGFRTELFSINTSKGFSHTQHGLLHMWLVSAYFWAIIRRPKPAIFVINYVVRDWTLVITFIDLSTTGLRHPKKIICRRKIPEGMKTILLIEILLSVELSRVIKKIFFSPL